MITDISDTSYRIDDQLIDLTVLYTRVQLLCDGKTIHTARNHYAVLKNTLFLLRRDGVAYITEERLLQRLRELSSILNRAHL